MAEVQRLMGHHMGMKKWRSPDIDWMLKMIATIDPDHQIFAKDWEVPREASPIREENLKFKCQMVMISSQTFPP